MLLKVNVKTPVLLDMKRSTISVLCVLLFLLVISASGYRQYQGVSIRGGERYVLERKSYAHHSSAGKRGTSLDNHLSYIRDTAGNAGNKKKAQQLAKQRASQRRRYN